MFGISKRGSARISKALGGFESTIAELQQGAIEAIAQAEQKAVHSQRVIDLQVAIAGKLIALLASLEARAKAFAAKKSAEATQLKADAKRAQVAAKRLSAAIGGSN